jgi:L-gulono-1,4-lactone dehydrogenase
MHTHYNYIWENAIGRQYAEPIKFFEPDNLGDIIHVVQQAESNGLEVRAVGSGSSQGDLGVCDGFLMGTSRINKVLHLRSVYLKTEAKNRNLFRVEAGITLKKLNEELDKYGLGIGHMGGNEKQTLGGAVATAAHGSFLDTAGIQDMIRSILMVTHEGEVVRIEPSEGLMDPEAYRVAGVRLIQDDDYFYSALVSLGSFGVIYSYILEPEDSYYLQESRELLKWSEVRPRLLNGSLFEEKYNDAHPYCGFLLQVNPYADSKGEHSCVLSRYRKIAGLPKSTFIQQLKGKLQTFLGNLPTSYLASRSIMRIFPSQTPQLIETSLQIMDKGMQENKHYKLMEKGGQFVKINSMSTEFAFDLQKSLRYVDVVEKLFAKVEKLREEQGYYQTLPFSLRFVKESKAYLAPEYGKDVCYIEVPVMLDSKGEQLMLQQFQQLMLNNGGTPHWSKVNDVLAENTHRLPEMYPKLAVWEKVFRKLNPNGHFSNDFIKRLHFGSLTSGEAGISRAA